jgi:uncharacterized membrane protein YkoI
MKKRYLAIICVVVFSLAALLHVGALAAANSTEQYIGEAKAKSVALENAGVVEADAIFLKVHLDHDDSRVVYEVEFYSGNTEYDYEIDAVDGQILESDKDIEYYSIPNRSLATTNAGQYIGEEKAKSAALEHAGVTAEQAIFIKAYLDHDDGRVVYDVEFYSGNTEYDYEIDAVSGDILESDKEIEYYSIPRNTAVKPNDTESYIGEAKAKSIALEHAGVAESQTAYINVHLDRDDGRVDYDVDFLVGSAEYEYEIDAVSGGILEFDRDTENRASRGNSGLGSRPPAANTENYIGEEKAKSIALSDAGLSESEVTRIKAELDRDDGRAIYEVDFQNGRMEYEYEIDATSGKILESNSEFDD